MQNQIKLTQEQEKLSAEMVEKFQKAMAEEEFKSTSFNERMPYVGETILFTANPDDAVARSNGHEGPIAAIVTRVWSAVCVNIKIIPDHGPMQDRGSVVHKSANPAGYHFEFLPREYDPLKLVFK